MLHEAKEIRQVVSSAYEESMLPLNPDKETLDDPAPLVATQPAAVLGLAFRAIGTLRGDHLQALGAQLRVERIAAKGFVADQVFGLRFDHVKIENQLHQRDFVIIRGATSTTSQRNYVHPQTGEIFNFADDV